MKYLQVNQDNIITDCISYPFQDYIEFEGEVPQSVIGGWHKLENGVIVEYLELKPMDKEDKIEILKIKQENTNLTLMGMMDMLMPPM